MKNTKYSLCFVILFLLLTNQIGHAQDKSSMEDVGNDYYTSSAKIVVHIKSEAKLPSNYDIVGTQIEILTSRDLPRRSLDRTRSLFPEMKEVPVKIQVSRVNETGVIKVDATAQSNVYVEAYLNQFIAEYLALRNEIITSETPQGFNDVIAKVIESEAGVKEAFRRRTLAKKNAAPAEELEELKKQHEQAYKDYEYWKGILEKIDKQVFDNGAKDAVGILEKASPPRKAP